MAPLTAEGGTIEPSPGSPNHRKEGGREHVPFLLLYVGSYYVLVEDDRADNGNQ